MLLLACSYSWLAVFLFGILGKDWCRGGHQYTQWFLNKLGTSMLGGFHVGFPTAIQKGPIPYFEKREMIRGAAIDLYR